MTEKIVGFPTTMTKTKRFFTESGKGIKDVYASRFDKNGNVIVEKKGTENIYGLIQSAADSVNINTLIAKFTSGDIEALNRKKALFIDTTNLPEDYFAAMNTINDAKDDFKRLSPEIKAKFDYDADKYVAAIGSGEWIAKLNGLDKKVEKAVIEEFKEEKETKVNE